jgi:hypothetical protein
VGGVERGAANFIVKTSSGVPEAFFAPSMSMARLLSSRLWKKLGLLMSNCSFPF